jgi:hypothetical protein
MWRVVLYLIITVPMIFFVSYMWTTYPDQVLLHSIGTSVMFVCNMALLTVLVVSGD